MRPGMRTGRAQNNARAPHTSCVESDGISSTGSYSLQENAQQSVAHAPKAPDISRPSSPGTEQDATRRVVRRVCGELRW